MLARVTTTAALLALALSACAKSDQRQATDTAAAVAPPATSAEPAGSTAAAPAAPAAPTLNDAQIAHVAVTANSIDSTAGVLAKKKGTSRAVKDFAQSMVNDHGAVNKQAVALATKLKVTPEDNDVSKSLKSGGDENIANLNGKSGAAFDSAYIDHEVAYHQAVLDALDQTLIPQSQNAELKGLLEKVRPSIAAHLALAKKIQSDLSKPTP